MLHDGVLSWVLLCVLMCAGGAAGWFCAGIAQRYGHLVCQGHYPDQVCLYQAMGVTFVRGDAPIILSSGNKQGIVHLVLTGLVLALTWGGLYVSHGLTLTFVLYALACAILMLLACIDMHTWLLPDALTLPLLWLGVLSAWAGAGVDLYASIAGVALGYGILGGLRLFWLWWRNIESMGAGDIKLLAAVGAWAGSDGVLLALLLASLTGFLFAMLHQRSWRPGGAYPFGPFLALGGVAALFPQVAVHSWFWA